MSFALVLVILHKLWSFSKIYIFVRNFFNATSILEGRVVKVSHSTQTAILQLVDPACAAAQEHIKTRIWNFHFLSVFLPSCGYGVFRQF